MKSLFSVAVISLALLLAPVSNGTLASAVAAHAIAHPGAPFIGFLGDSITQGYPGWNTDYYSWASPSGDPNYNIANRVYVDSGNLVVGVNHGVNGSVASPTSVVLADEIGNLHPKYVIVQYGINNISSAETWADALPDYNNMLAAFVADGVQMIVSEVWPWSSATNTAILNWNTALKAWAATNSVPVILSHDWLADPTDLMVIKPSRTGDGQHPTAAGTERWAQAVLGKLRNLEGDVHTYVADDTTKSAFTIAYGMAANGDTVSIPAGNSIWSTKTTITKAVTIKGTLTPISAISSFSVANPTVVTTSSAHGLTTGDKISINGVTGGTLTSPGIGVFNGVLPVIVTGASTFTVPLGVSSAPTGGTVSALSTIIRDGVVGDFFFDITLNGGAGATGTPAITTRIKNIHFQNGGGDAGAGSRFLTNGTNFDNRRLVIEQNAFIGMGASILFNYTCIGVFSNNTVYPSVAGVMFHTLANSWDKASGNDNGDSSFGEGENYGSDQFMFFENNYLVNPATTAFTDGHSGGRYVFRNNTGINGSMQTHGAEAGRGRGGRAFEVYRNHLTGDGVWGGCTFWRGGSGLIWENYFPNWGPSPVHNLVNYKTHEDAPIPFSGSTGRNAWDINDAGNPFDTGVCDSSGTNTVTDTGQGWGPNVWQNYQILKKTTSKVVTSQTWSSMTYNTTVVCPGHGLVMGDWFSIWGANEYFFNSGGLFPSSIVDANTFTYTDFSAVTTAATGGPIYLTKGNRFTIINSNTSETITFNPSAHPAGLLTFAAGDTFEINKVTQSMDQVGRWGTDFGGVWAPAIPVGWNNQTTSPWYEWSNTSTAGADVDFTTGRSGAVGTLYPQIVNGTHYHNDTVFSYTPYTFPHPLVSDSLPAVAGGSVTFGPGAGSAAFGAGAGSVSFQ